MTGPFRPPVARALVAMASLALIDSPADEFPEPRPRRLGPLPAPLPPYRPATASQPTGHQCWIAWRGRRGYCPKCGRVYHREARS